MNNKLVNESVENTEPPKPKKKLQLKANEFKPKDAEEKKIPTFEINEKDVALNIEEQKKMSELKQKVVESKLGQIEKTKLVLKVKEKPIEDNQTESIVSEDNQVENNKIKKKITKLNPSKNYEFIPKTLNPEKPKETESNPMLAPSNQQNTFNAFNPFSNTNFPPQYFYQQIPPNFSLTNMGAFYSTNQQGNPNMGYSNYGFQGPLYSSGFIGMQPNPHQFPKANPKYANNKYQNPNVNSQKNEMFDKKDANFRFDDKKQNNYISSSTYAEKKEFSKKEVFQNQEAFDYKKKEDAKLANNQKESKKSPQNEKKPIVLEVKSKNQKDSDKPDSKNEDELVQNRKEQNKPQKTESKIELQIEKKIENKIDNSSVAKVEEKSESISDKTDSKTVKESATSQIQIQKETVTQENEKPITKQPKISLFTNQIIPEKKIAPPEKPKVVKPEELDEKTLQEKQKLKEEMLMKIKQDLEKAKFSQKKINERSLMKFVENYSGQLKDEAIVLKRKVINIPNTQRGKYQTKEETGKKNRDRDDPRDRNAKYDFKSSRVTATKPSNTNVTSNSKNEKQPEAKPGSTTNLTVLTRTNFSPTHLQKVRDIKEKAGEWIYGKKGDDDEKKKKKEIQFLLNKITMDNFDKLSEQIMTFAKEQSLSETIVNNLVEKAWKEPRYTKCYTQLVKKLANLKLDWDNIDKKKAFYKNSILARVEEEYTEGFVKYRQFTQEIHFDSTKTPDEKFEELTKRKLNLIGNINFICELFEQQILSFLILKIVVLYGIGNFMKEYLRTEIEKDDFSIKEDYIEALLKLFDNIGMIIEKKDNSHSLKEKIEEPSNDAVYNGIKIMFDQTVDKSVELLEKDVIEEKAKNLNGLCSFFFKFLELVSDKKVSIRVQSLIENLFEYRDSNWKLDIKRISAAKTLAEVHREEKEEPKTDQLSKERSTTNKSGPKNNSKHNENRDDEYVRVENTGGKKRNTKFSMKTP